MNPFRKRRALPALLGYAAGSALVLAGCGGSTGGASLSTTSTSPAHAPTPLSTSFDSCLVGRWVETQETDTVIYNGLPVALTGDGGKVLTFTPNGTETVNYAHAVPLEGPYGTGIYEVRGSGTAVYHDGTQGGELIFDSSDYSHFSQSVSVDGKVVPTGSLTTPTPVSYQCTARTLHQTTEVFSGDYSRQ